KPGGASPTPTQKRQKKTMQERLQKIIARAGIASRRHAESLITSGQVLVNGRVVKELGTKADAAKDHIEAAGRVVQAKEGRRVYILLNKPPELVSAMADPEGRKTLRNCLRGLPERVFPVGNLEYAASGLVFLTNDGDLAAEMLKRSEEHTSELQSLAYLVCRLLLEKKKTALTPPRLKACFHHTCRPPLRQTPRLHSGAHQRQREAPKNSSHALRLACHLRLALQPTA